MNIKQHFNDFTSRWSTGFITLLGLWNILFYFCCFFIIVLSEKSFFEIIKAIISIPLHIPFSIFYSALLQPLFIPIFALSSLTPVLILLLKKKITPLGFVISIIWIACVLGITFVKFYQYLPQAETVVFLIVLYGWVITPTVLFLGMIPYLIILKIENKKNSRIQADFVKHPAYKIFATILSIVLIPTFVAYSVVAIGVILIYIIP